MEFYVTLRYPYITLEIPSPQYYPDCRLIYLTSSCSLALLQLGSRYSSSQHHPEAPPAITSTKCSNQDVASAILWKFQQAPKTRCEYARHSIWPLCSPDYFLDGPLAPAALFLFSAQLFPANCQYTAMVRLSLQQYMRKRSQL